METTVIMVIIITWDRGNNLIGSGVLKTWENIIFPSNPQANLKKNLNFQTKVYSGAFRFHIY